MFLSTGLLIILLIIILFMFGIITITFSDNGRVVNNENSRNENNVVEGFDDTDIIIIGVIIGVIAIPLIISLLNS